MLILVTKSNSFFQWLVTWNGGASICAADRRKWLSGKAEQPWSLYIRLDRFSVEIQVRAVLALGLQLWLLAGMGCQGYGCGLCAAGLERYMISAWSGSFSVESGLHAETEYQRGIGQKRISVGLQSHLSFSVEFFIS